MMTRVALLCLFLSCGSAAFGISRSDIPEAYDEFEGPDLALRLALDGKFALAEKVRADFSANRSAVMARVRGLLAEDAGDLTAAERELGLAATLVPEKGPVDDELSWERSRVAAALHKWKDCASLLSQHVALKKVESAVTYTRCLAAAGESEQAFRFSARAVAQYPQNVVVIRERVAVLMATGLVVTAESEARSALGRTRSAADTATLAFELFDLVAEKDPRAAQSFLELARLRLGDGDGEVRAKLAQHLFRRGQELTAATEFAALASARPQYYLPASELSRLAGWDVQGLQLAMMIPDARNRFRQKATFELASGRVQAVGTLAASFDRTFSSRLEPQDENWAYAIAYGRLRAGAWRERGPLSPAGLLSRIRGADLVEKAVQLRARISECSSVGTARCSFE